MKTCIVVDSACGLTKKEAEKRGWKYLPLIATIDRKDYRDGIDLNPQKFYGMANIEQEVRTSATPPGVIKDVLEKASNEFDEVIVYPLSQGLSSQMNNVKAIAKNIKNVKVVNSKGVGYAIVYDIEEALAKGGDIYTTLNQLTIKQWGITFPYSLKWLVKGGRVTPAAAAMANLLKIVPIIKFEDGKLDKYGKGRSYNKTVLKNTRLIKEASPDSKFLIYRGKFDGDEELIKEMKKIVGDVPVEYFPPIIATHTGPQVVALIERKE